MKDVRFRVPGRENQSIFESTIDNTIRYQQSWRVSTERIERQGIRYGSSVY